MRVIRPMVGIGLIAGLFCLGWGLMIRAIPTIVTDDLFRQFFAAGRTVNTVVPARLRDARRNLVAMDNSDTVTRSIIYDVADQPLVIDTDVPAGLAYWSLSIFANNTDTLFVANDQRTGAGPYRVVIRRSGQPRPTGADADADVVSPTDRGFVIFRGVTHDRTDPADVERTIAAMAGVDVRAGD
ncbi:DUF1254 domain-containing protein [Hephaestia sp. GCM10023244]|uniref:DUF1254 domain-containing protein n=1 Tax=unclassified Hephaestia TaxID=2631281 RepID=UPI00207798AF|nr:DUF1254 domain-containing protein [Hephaestia sp. MAHUQ-44]MCM8732492.1 DUF1254 domain-containing protein [Hephaestia sp. MAHUQ-44]